LLHGQLEFSHDGFYGCFAPSHFGWDCGVGLSEMMMMLMMMMLMMHTSSMTSLPVASYFTYDV
jgi:hypothetical protein